MNPENVHFRSGFFVLSFSYTKEMEWHWNIAVYILNA